MTVSLRLDQKELAEIIIAHFRGKKIAVNKVALNFSQGGDQRETSFVYADIEVEATDLQKHLAG